jgi:putative ABC transport system permease protein
VGLGIGATTTIFSIINSVLIQPLPYRDPGQLVRIYTDAPPNRWPLSVADYRALEEQQTSFSSIAGYNNQTVTLRIGQVAERIRGKFVTGSYFSLLGVAPLHGRVFDRSEGAPRDVPTVVISHGLWTRYFGGDAEAIGRSISLNDRPYTVVGVLPPDVGPFEQNRDFFAAVQWEPPPRKGPFFIVALGRLKPGTEATVAVEELRSINRRIFPVWQDSYQDEAASWGMMDLKEVVVGDVGGTLVIVLCGVGFVLLIASTNAANLLLARVTHRGRELAVRAAIGASRGRLLQHLLSESALLAVGGAACGILLLLGGLRLLSTVGGDYLPRAAEISVDGTVLWFLAALTVGSGLLFGTIPSLQGTRARTDQALRSGGRAFTETKGQRRIRRALVASQFAIAAPLLIGAGLLIGSLARLSNVDPGIDTHNILSAGVFLPPERYREPGEINAFWTEAIARVQVLPGVQSATLGNARPPDQIPMTNNFNLEDKPTPPSETQPSVPWLGVLPGYFETLGISLLAGRPFDVGDRDGAAPVAIVDRAWAQRFFPNERVVGRRFQSGGCTTCPLVTIVGVVADVKYTGLDGFNRGTVYRPILDGGYRSMYFLVRTSADPMMVLPALRNVMGELDPTLPLSEIATIDERMRDSLEAPRYLASLVAGFATIALLLSIVGIYGVMSHFVQQHAKDIGIRIALGGGPRRVLGSIVGQGMRVVGFGTAVGVGLGLVVTRFMSSLLFGVGTADPLTFAAVATLMLGVALIACFVPARRAARVNPVETLREE